MAAISWPECGKCCCHQCHYCHWPEATDRRPNLWQFEPDRVLTLEVSVSLAKFFRKNAKRSQLMPFTRRLPWPYRPTYVYGAIFVGAWGEWVSDRFGYYSCIGFPPKSFLLILARHRWRFVNPPRLNKFIKLKNAQSKSNQSEQRTGSKGVCWFLWNCGGNNSANRFAISSNGFSPAQYHQPANPGAKLHLQKNVWLMSGISWVKVIGGFFFKLSTS